MGQCLKICEGTFCLKMVDSTAITGQIILILVLDRFKYFSYVLQISSKFS